MADRKSTTPQLAAFLLCTTATSVFAQRPGGMPSSPVIESPQPALNSSTTTTPTLKVKSNLTIEDVTVMDAKGKPVHGLTQGDFTVREDGKPQRIMSFQEYGTEIPSAQSAPPVLPPNFYTNAQPSASTRAINILLLDTLSVGLTGQAYVREKTMSYLKSMPPGTEIAIFELGLDSLRMLHGFTTDRESLEAAVHSYSPDMALNPQGVMLDMGVCRILNARSRATTGGLDAIATAVSGMPGRKNLIWFSIGLQQITDYAFMVSTLPCLEDLRPELQRSYARLNAAQVAVYPIDPHGLGGGDPTESLGEFGMDRNSHSTFFSMQEIAANTGGMAYHNRNDIDAAMGEAIANGSDYYSLSYVPPPSKYDGKYHSVEVKVDRPGLNLQYREGYTEVDLAKRLPIDKAGKDAPARNSSFRAAVDLALVPSTALTFVLHVTPSTAPAKPGEPPVAGMLHPKLKDKPLVRYVLLYEIPPSEATLLDGPNRTRTASLELDAVAYGEDGVKLNVVRDTVNFTLKPDQVEYFTKNPVVIPLQLDLPPGQISLHAGVLDVNSQKWGTLEIPHATSVK